MKTKSEFIENKKANVVLFTSSLESKRIRATTTPSEESQLQALENYCNMHSLNKVQSFCERVLSKESYKCSDRITINDLIEFTEVNYNEIDIVLVTRWEIVASDCREIRKIISRFQEIGVELNSIMQPIDFTNSNEKILLVMYMAVPEIERTAKNN